MAISVRTAAVACLLALVTCHAPARAHPLTRTGPAAGGHAWGGRSSWESIRQGPVGQSTEIMELVDKSPFGTSLTLQQFGISPSAYSAWLEGSEAGDSEGILQPITESGTPGDCACIWPNFCYCCGEIPLWTVKIDGLLLRRSTARSLDLLFGPAPVLNVADLEFQVESGPRVSLTRVVSGNWDLEINYFSVDSWSASAVRNGDPLLIYPPGVMSSTQYTVDYDSAIYSTEVNLIHRWGDFLDLLAGFRHVQLHEDFHVVGALVPPQPVATRYDTRAGNYLYGFQIGTEAKLYDLGGPLRLVGFLKTGVYGNSASQSTFRVGNLGIEKTASDQKNHLALLAELGLTAVCRLGDHWAVRGGYQAMWLEGVALAPDQIPFTDVSPFTPGGADLDTTGSLFYHGCHIGLEARW